MTLDPSPSRNGLGRCGSWYEHQPVRAPANPGHGPRIYRRLRWGNLAQIDIVDGRQYRSVPPCGWGEAQACAPMIGFNPHIKFFDGDRRGYIRCTVRPAQMTADLKVVGTVSRPDVPESTFASFVLEDGKPGAILV